MNGNKDPKNNQEEEKDDVTNDTRMVSNPVQQGQAPSMPPTPVATPSQILPSKWSPPFNLSSFSSGIPLDSLNSGSGGSKENKKERKNDNKKKNNKKKKRRKGKKDKAQVGPLYPLVPSGKYIL